MNTPQILYKYCPLARTNILTERRVRFTPLGLLNDPFEASPLVHGIHPDSLTRGLMRVGEEPHSAITRASAEEFFRSAGPGILAREVRKTFGVFCLSESPTDPLMWAHYGDEHRGFVLGFDAAHRWFDRREDSSDPINHLQRVTYQTQRPQLLMAEPRDQTPEEMLAWVKAACLTKPVAWQYEKEWRIVRPVRDATEVRDEKIHLFGFPADVVHEVVLGARMPSAEAQGLVLDARREMPGANISRLQLSPTTYELDRVDATESP